MLWRRGGDRGRASFAAPAEGDREAERTNEREHESPHVARVVVADGPPGRRRTVHTDNLAPG